MMLERLRPIFSARIDIKTKEQTAGSLPEELANLYLLLCACETKKPGMSRAKAK